MTDFVPSDHPRSRSGAFTVKYQSTPEVGVAAEEPQMSQFEVSFAIKGTHSVQVEAPNAEAAVEIALEKASEDPRDFAYELEHSSTHEVQG